jgi:transglutaminase-like putative cysteine protease
MACILITQCGLTTFAEDIPAPVFEPGSRTVDCTYEVVLNEIPNTAELLNIWVPLPISNAIQHITNIDFTTPVPFNLVADETFQNRFLHIELNEAQLEEIEPPIKISIQFRAKRMAIEPSRTTFKFPHVTQADLQKYLTDSIMLKSDGAVAKEAAKIIGQAKDHYEQAQRIYSHIVETVKYDKTGDGWGRGDSVYACTVREGNCSDFHSLFIGELRSLSIPSRFIMGYPLPTTQTKGIVPGYHCWAEFFLNEKGWYPVDASKAHQQPELKEALFGGLDAHRIEFTAGRDIVLPNMQDGPLNFSIYPHVEIDGKQFDQVTREFRFENVAQSTAGNE